MVDRTSFLRDALKNTLLSIGNVEVVAEASTGKEFIELLDKHEADIVFIDINIEEINGIEATKIATKKHRNMAIIGFSGADRQCYVNQMVEAGANGFLSKCTNNYDILSKIIENPQKGNFFSAGLEINTKTSL